jgi:flagellar protein FlaG
MGGERALPFIFITREVPMGIEIPNNVLQGQKMPAESFIPEKTPPVANAPVEKSSEKPILSKIEIDKAMESLVRAASIFGKRLKYYINDDIGMVVVKVVDEETDKVIKEIPSTEIQHLIANLKETIGVLVDEKI